ncbi:MAG: hypothetical protein EGR97_08120 [Clostridiales bacterium]|nr:hypothetical protein [Clostridiales bacterium]
MLNRVKLAAKRFCKKLKYDTSIVSLINYFDHKKYKIIYFDKSSEDFKPILSCLHIYHCYKDLQSFTYRSETKSYVCIASNLNQLATRQCLLREAAHIELKHDTLKNISGNNFSMLCEASDFARYASNEHKPIIPANKVIYTVIACVGILSLVLSLYLSLNRATNNVSQDASSPKTISDSMVPEANYIMPLAEKEDSVYITKTGECFHKRDCRYATNGVEISLTEANEKGYKPCSICNP